MLLAPLSYIEVYLAFIAAAVLRGLMVGIGVYVVSSMFVALPVFNLAILISFALLGSAVLGTLGMIAGIWAEKFDQLAGFQNFVILPLSFLSGVFYSIHSLPDFWQKLSHINPFFYMIDGFRYGFFGISDVSPVISITVTVLFLSLLSITTIFMLRRGYKLRG